MPTTKCPHCSKPGGTVKVVAEGNGTGRAGRPGYRDQRPQTRFWHQACIDAFEAQAAASRERFLDESREQAVQAIIGMGKTEEEAREIVASWPLHSSV